MTALLTNLLSYVKENVTFYNNYIPSTIHQDTSLEEVTGIFQSLPIVSKQEIKTTYKDFVSKEILQFNLDEIFSLERDFNKEYQFERQNLRVMVEYTSGSSGVPFALLKKMDERILLGRELWKLRNRISKARPDDCFYFIHTFKDDLYPFPFPKPKIEKDKVEKEINYLLEDKKSWWHINGYILNYYYNFLTQYSVNSPFSHLKVIENNGSYISEEEKQAFRDFFSCKVVNNYGTREIWGIAYDCPCGYLHVNEDAVLLELVDDDGMIIEDPEIEGHVIVTSLRQKAMPFIRYRLNDYASYMAGDCACGRKTKRITLLPGRNMIYGTQLYGNKVFKDIISFLSLKYKLTNYHSINILQTERNAFHVNIKGNKENKELLENAFLQAAAFILKDKAYNYSFSYDDHTKPKSLFQVKLQS